jgi:hypothetical protein
MRIVENFHNTEDIGVIKTYIKQYLHEDKNNLYYEESTADV